MENLPATRSTMADNPVLWAQTASEYFGLAKGIANSSLVPKAYQGRPDDITAAWLMGAELNLPPMMALNNVQVIEGRASLTANAMRGVAMAAGVMFEIDEQSDTRVVMRAKGPGQSKWTPSVWTMDRAAKMGLDQKSNWKKMPQAMLVARATSELCRLVAANVLMGLPYSVEELTDLNQQDEPAYEPKTLRRRRAPLRAEIPEPPLDEPAQPDEPEKEPPPRFYREPEGQIIGRAAEEPPRQIESTPDIAGYADDGQDDIPEQDRVSPTTRSAIMAGFNELNIRDRAERLLRVSAVIGREVFSVNQLSETEGRAVVRKLVQLRQEPEDVQWPEAAAVPS